MVFRIFFVLAATAFVSIPASASAQDFLNADQLKEFYSDRIIETRGRDGVDMVQHFKAGGVLITEFDRPGNLHTHESKWWVTDDGKICFNNAKGRQFCNKISKTTDGYKRFNPRGQALRGYWKPRL